MDTPTLAVIDDDPIMLDLLVEIGRAAGYRRTVQFNDPSEACYKLVSATAPHVICTDFHMAGMNGVELLDALLPRMGEAVGVIVTGDPEGARSKAAGRYLVVNKVNGLVSRLRRILQGELRARTAAGP